MSYKDPAKRNAYRRRWKRNNPDKVKAYGRLDRERYGAKIKKRNRDWELKRCYGFSLAEYEAMYQSQNGLCRVCDRRFELLHVDHDHETGKVRGLLCGSCNRGLGLLGEDPLRIAALLSYVHSWGRWYLDRE